MKLWSTIEPQHLVEAAYPDLVRKFKESKMKPAKKPRKRKGKVDGVEDIEDMLANTSIGETGLKPKGKSRKLAAKKAKCVEAGGSFDLKESTPKKCVNLKIDDYFKKALMNNLEKIRSESPEIQIRSEPPEILIRSGTPEIRTSFQCTSFNMDLSNFGDENESDLSDIIDDIIKRDPLHFLRGGLEGCEGERSKVVEASFFGQTEEVDLFEKTFNEICGGDSDDETIEYEVDEKEFEMLENDESDDDFLIDCAPLGERLNAGIL